MLPMLTDEVSRIARDLPGVRIIAHVNPDELAATHGPRILAACAGADVDVRPDPAIRAGRVFAFAQPAIPAIHLEDPHAP